MQRLTRTRNVLLGNMALSNLGLCVFTMPLTLLDLLHHYWPLASGQEILCKLTSHTQSTFIFFSSWSVMLIAIDRLDNGHGINIERVDCGLTLKSALQILFF